MTDAVDVGRTLSALHVALCPKIFDFQVAAQPDMMREYADKHRERCIEDTRHHLAFLIGALLAARPAMFVEYVASVKVLFAHLGLPDACLSGVLGAIRHVLHDELAPEQAAIACDFVDRALSQLSAMPLEVDSFLSDDAPLGKVAVEYLEALLSTDRARARRMILEALDGGASVRELYLDVFERCQQEIGRLWQMNRVSVAQEHYCTASTQVIMAQLYPLVFAGPRKGRRMVATCVSGELHELGMRMVADLFELDGWDTFFVGANIPAEAVVRTVLEQKPDILGVSVTLSAHLGEARALIRSLRRADPARRTKVMVGGRPFRLCADLWQEIDADGYAENAAQAVATAEEIRRGDEAQRGADAD